ncbi:Transcriptional regulatory protein RcsB [Paraburkholderia fynbosensis]|uniref:Transcriptional regulatory protein RcsB n=2 Tax=Paraburkholderia fynbosensis TaxID=1200993 RepID=A0A6J5G969_9BURK|nr:Transcriptional regulatory protein RcsB [Paraburkholderia fynbosensis]
MKSLSSQTPFRSAELPNGGHDEEHQSDEIYCTFNRYVILMNSTRIVHVVVADDHAVVRRAVAQTIDAIPGFKIAAIVKSGTELLEILTAVECDLIVTDFSMQRGTADEDGLRLIARLRRNYPSTPIIVFTMLTNGGVLQKLCKMGVAGIVGKDEESAVIEQACVTVRSHLNARTFLSPGITQWLVQDGNTAEGFLSAPDLSPKELEVVRLFGMGLSVTQIAQQLNRTATTVATQKRSAMRKLHVETNADLVKYAQEQGLT